MKNLPVILLTFANDLTAYLENLKRESYNLNQALEPWEDEYAIKVFREENATTKEIIHAINRFDGSILLFHYGGHADGEALQLEGGAGHADGLAQLLQQQKQLQLVFLNGCSTAGQVNRLLGLGIKAVIATTAHIDDGRATEFAEHFYQKLAKGGTLQQSFAHACASLSFVHTDGPAPQVYPVRGLAIRTEKGDEKLPWGLYYQEDQPEVLDWVLPYQLSLSTFEDAQAYESNAYLYSILGEMVANNESLGEGLDSLVDDREYLDLIIKNFPWNIGAQVAKLVSNDPEMLRPGPKRLEQLANTYIAAGQFLFFVLLSQAWDEKKNGSLSEVADFGRFFCLNPAQFAGFDYIGGFQELCGLLQENGIAPFLPEAAFCWEGLKDKKEFYDAYLFLESIRHRLEKPALLQDKLAGLCEDGEYFLSVFLSALAFLANYQLLTVRDIILCNYRHREAEYRHYLGRLNAHTEARLGLFREPRVFKDFLDSDSIVLLKNLGHLRPYLNLTPFYIDKNAFARDKQSIPAMDLFTFAYCNGGEYIYVKSSSNLLQSPAQGHNLLSTSLEISQDNRNRRLKSKYLLSRHEPGSRPFLVLEEQFEKLKTA